MFKNPLLRTVALGAALIAAATPSKASASVVAPSTQTTGSSTVTMKVPDVIILDYFTNINLGLAGQTDSYDHSSYEQSDLNGGDQTIDGTGELSTDTLTDAKLAALKGSDVNLTLKNAWAVRGFSSTGKATVSIDGDSTLKKASSSSTIGVSKLQVQVSGGTASKSITTDLKGIQKGNATLGDVVMGLNFANTSVSGDYTATITITAVTM
ncbi:MAG: hypothetical protein LWW75_03170 [Chlorobiales bacterium]|nr:hypothetical protein [Chlorobiales bacterium]